MAVLTIAGVATVFAGDTDDEAVTVTLPSVDRQPSAPKTWRVTAAEADAGEHDTDSGAAAAADAAGKASLPRQKAPKRRPQVTSTSKQSIVKPEPADTAAAGAQSEARSTRSRKRAR